jgi:hypothetical protein
MATIINASTSAGLVQTADTSGNLNLQSNGSTIVAVTSTGAAVTGTLSASGAFTPSTMGGSVITSGTAQASTSGTSIDFTGIPSWAKRITVMFSGVSTAGSVFQPLIQIGDSGGIEANGYVSTGAYFNTSGTFANTQSTYGFLVNGAQAVDTLFGALTLSLLDSATNTWVASGNFAGSSSAVALLVCGGGKSLTATLDRVRITTVNGTDTFDAGSINIMYE